MSESSMKLLSLATQMGWYKKPSWSFGGGRLPVLLEGVPGCGKTQAIKRVLGPALQKRLDQVSKDPELAKYLAHEYLGKFAVGTLVVPQTSPETIEGIPVPDFTAKELSRYPLDTIKAAAESVYGILFFDEVTSGQEATGASIMTTVQDGIAGSTTLPDTVAIHLACNPPDQAAAGRDLSLPEINRVMKLSWEMPPAAFLDFLNGGKGLAAEVAMLPPDWEDKHLIKASTLISNFLRVHPRLQNTVQSGVHKGDGPWASERSWTNAIRMLAACFSLGELASSSLFYNAAKGMVGGTADSLSEWLKEMDIPDPELLLAEAMRKGGDPMHLIPETVNRPDKRKVMLESVARCAIRDHKDKLKRWEAAWEIVGPFLDTNPDEAQEALNVLNSDVPPGARVPEAASKLWKIRRAAGIIPG